MIKPALEGQTKPLPLVVDLDGTLIRSDMLVESFFALLSQSPWRALKTLPALFLSRAAFKTAIAQRVQLDVASLPFNEELLTWLKAEKARGRGIYLASASHESYVHAVAHHLGIFTGVFASDANTNLKSQTKAEKLCQIFGEKQFDYIGNEKADIAVWERASGVIMTNTTNKFQIKVAQRFPAAQFIATPRATLKDYRRAFRPHQWLKNVLIFVPMLAAHDFTLAALGSSLLAFASFSLCASSGYILNDLLDLQNDRQHHSKKNRPFAAGRINLLYGAQMMVGSLLAAVAIGLALPATFLLVLLSYYVLSLAYSTVIKRQLILDVVLLSLLYGLRLIAGGVALAIPLSAWLLSFSTFFFLSLALVKRCSELVARQQRGAGDPSGRSYRLTDLPMLESMAAAAGYVAALTSGLYISSDNVAELYVSPQGLWAIPIILLFWVSRMLVITHRGEMHDDPVLFAARDRVSLVCGAAIVTVLVVSM